MRRIGAHFGLELCSSGTSLTAVDKTRSNSLATGNDSQDRIDQFMEVSTSLVETMRDVAEMKTDQAVGFAPIDTEAKKVERFMQKPGSSFKAVRVHTLGILRRDMWHLPVYGDLDKLFKKSIRVSAKSWKHEDKPILKMHLSNAPISSALIHASKYLEYMDGKSTDDQSLARKKLQTALNSNSPLMVGDFQKMLRGLRPLERLQFVGVSGKLKHIRVLSKLLMLSLKTIHCCFGAIGGNGVRNIPALALAVENMIEAINSGESEKLESFETSRLLLAQEINSIPAKSSNSGVQNTNFGSWKRNNNRSRRRNRNKKNNSNSGGQGNQKKKSG